MRNKSLVRLHRGIAAFYMAVFLFIVYAVVSKSTASLSGLWVLGFIAAVPIGLHLWAGQGAKAGAGWGKTLSRVLATLLLVGFPIGTVLGGLIWVKTSQKDWQAA
ncbi:hypothetical protein [Variovorax sp. OK605]|jgi:hypothetical protein|uniref:hypothetical protein n=1 Tax=Variovorax sp. OK605 TaxID=1855317 RepID=UPI000B87125C|nr:hypothetical protein [Variovorax sp. OK605]